MSKDQEAYKRGYAQAELDLKREPYTKRLGCTMTDEQLLEYRRVKLLERDKQLSKLVEENSKLREDLREGISLRDHFAGLAMQGVVVSRPTWEDTRRIALTSYEMADAMLAERGKNENRT